VNFGVAPAVDFRIALDVALASQPNRYRFSGEHKYGTNGTERIDETYTLSSFTITPTVLASLRLNLGSIYTMAFGFRAGIDIPAGYGDGWVMACGNSETTPGSWTRDKAVTYKGTGDWDSPVFALIGPEVSLLSFRFGEKREMELESSQGLILPVGKDVAFHTGLAFRYLFLPQPAAPD
jgi:hypothetical protein